jgi:hypothetical protein
VQGTVRFGDKDGTAIAGRRGKHRGCHSTLKFTEVETLPGPAFHRLRERLQLRVTTEDGALRH